MITFAHAILEDSRPRRWEASAGIRATNSSRTWTGFSPSKWMAEPCPKSDRFDIGEQTLVEGRERTATLRAGTPAGVAVAAAAEIQTQAFQELAGYHLREDASNPRVG